MSRNVQVVLLCEDRQQQAFASRFLKRAGRGYRLQRVEFCPKGCGEQFVRERFAKELGYYRSRQYRVGQALIVFIDADTKGVTERIEQVEDGAVKSGQSPRQINERVAIFVPARNIETWIAYLDGQTVTEKDKYPHLKHERDCLQHVESLYEMCQQGALRQPAPPSLETACVEYRSRLQQI